MDIPEDLIELERAAETERAKLAGLDGEEWEAQRRVYRDAAEAVQAAIAKHAKGPDRYELEMAVKRAVRHQQENPAE